MNEKQPFNQFVEEILLPLVDKNALVSLSVSDGLGNKASIRRDKHGILRVTTTLTADINPMKL
ncbi:hypothetical protein ACP26L_36125 (plasmid) [Paenibacillus sp. S-38]|uniref:hypothetical protein n=1 Tax=Paenibacillus sp. S-38 TaxID=3416710 RepID=UPI003CF89062